MIKDFCDCRWCSEEHPGGMLLFVTLPSNKYASSEMDQNHYTYEADGLESYDLEPTEEGQLFTGDYGGRKVKHSFKNRRPPNMNRHTYGRLLIPPGGFDGRDIDDIVAQRIPWACDNGAFNIFDEKRWKAMIDRVAGHPYCHFCACPDVVWNKYPDGQRHKAAERTIELFHEYAPYIKERGLPVALVGQNNIDRYDIPWDMMDAYFLGSSDDWRQSPESEAVIKEAIERGLWVHIGRVSGLNRLRWCRSVGAGSFDGSAFGRFRDAPDKKDGLGRLQAGLMVAGTTSEARMFNDLEYQDDMTYWESLYADIMALDTMPLTPTEETETSDVESSNAL